MSGSHTAFQNRVSVLGISAVPRHSIFALILIQETEC